ncbi:superoxide dismutase family protein [Methylobacillus glycogenes]|uniref:superoxide dismutase family protein n=1 Tax=Methylobacillus glycogenes TaxID=406 RepID=UPI000A9352F7
MKSQWALPLLFTSMFLSNLALADIAVPVRLVDESGVGESLGQVLVTESKFGVVFTPALKGLTPGLHGFHLHQNPSCDTNEKDGKKVAAGGAGGHLDPANANKHGTPWGMVTWVTCHRYLSMKAALPTSPYWRHASSSRT